MRRPFLHNFEFKDLFLMKLKISSCEDVSTLSLCSISVSNRYLSPNQILNKRNFKLLKLPRYLNIVKCSLFTMSKKQTNKHLIPIMNEGGLLYLTWRHNHKWKKWWCCINHTCLSYHCPKSHISLAGMECKLKRCYELFWESDGSLKGLRITKIKKNIF